MKTGLIMEQHYFLHPSPMCLTCWHIIDIPVLWPDAYHLLASVARVHNWFPPSCGLQSERCRVELAPDDHICFDWQFLPISSRKRRKQTHVPVESKDDKYWARRMKNNEAAKRSRDMRIKREKVVFEENSRLEQQNRDLRSELVSRASNPENDLLITRRAYVPSLISS